MRISIVDYGSGNLHSAQKAFERAAREASLVADIALTSDPERLRTSDRIVLPGVGAFADCRNGLVAVPGMVDAIRECVVAKARPFLGICVGQQLMATRGLEKTETPGLDWIAGDVVEISPADSGLKVPQIGWNTLDVRNRHPLLDGIPTGPEGWHAYFVHSYHIAVKNPEERIAVTDYGGEVTAIVGRDNMVGTQFHPEKSQKLGLALIGNFLKWNP
ncbi:MAG: imidazole glycerol phosphate synthase subunit HisH [Nitratireductor sp.]|nr:imidazole glycerol phosphate synthase subunit HisH [Nitratireductor sp.]MCB1455138.1 imidazole glycerol phosphate synthase subunit HisH [Nitratireductor sp.]